MACLGIFSLLYSIRRLGISFFFVKNFCSLLLRSLSSLLGTVIYGAEDLNYCANFKGFVSFVFFFFFLFFFVKRQDAGSGGEREKIRKKESVCEREKGKNGDRMLANFILCWIRVG